MKYSIPILILISLLSFTFAAAKEASFLLSIDENTHINDAIRILETYSYNQESKKLINLSNFNSKIGIPIHQQDWKRALELIAVYNQLKIEEFPGYYAIHDVAVKEDEVVEIKEELMDVKLVKIEARALLADRAYLKSLGIDWSTIFDGTVEIGAGFFGAQQVPSSLMELTLSKSASWDGKTIDINTLLNVIESNQKGSIIAQPTILVNSGKRGFIQVGQDISIKTVDEAGNTTDTFFATGVIMDVTPTVVKIDDTDVVHMNVSIERSSGNPGAVSTIITKSKSETELVLYNGEEIVIGGLYDTDETHTRSGIPILKDLPWWVFGIRYLTGYDKYEKKERELVIFMKVHIVPNALERQKQALKELKESK